MNTPESHAMGLAIALEAIHPHNADSLLALSVVKSSAAELCSLHEMNAELLTGMKSMVRAYVNLLESARDRIIFLGGSCDDVDVMESNDPVLREARTIIDKARARL